jgi:hypothetical protein
MKPTRSKSYHRPLMARFSRNRSSAKLWCKTEDGYIALTIGPGYSAHFTRKSSGQTREVTLSNARDCCAFVTSDLIIKGDDVDRKVVTSYVTKTTREDVLEVRAKKVMRSVRWVYPQNLEARAIYSDAGRTLQWFERGELVGGVTTTAQRTPGGWESSNRVMDAPGGPTPPTHSHQVTTLGSSVVDVHTSTAGGDTSYGVTIMGAGEAPALSSIVGSVEHVRPHLDEHRVVVSIASSNGKGDAEGFTQNVISNQGGTTVTTRQTSNHGDGSSESTHGLAQASGDGSFSTLTDFEKDGQLVQRSSYVNDGKGNESETTVTHDKDGSFTIETISKDPAGNVSGSAQRFDKDGNPLGPPSGPSSGGPTPTGSPPSPTDETPDEEDNDPEDDDPHDDDDKSPDGDDDGPDDGPGDEDGMPADDDSSSSGKRRPGRNGPLGEFPSDDGSDPTPTPFSSDRGGSSMERWLAGLSPFYGGLTSRFGGSHINPATSIADSIDGGDGGDREPSTGQSGDGASASFDLTAVIRKENDPENDPRALVNVLAKLAGLPESAAGMQAAVSLAAYLGRR